MPAQRAAASRRTEGVVVIAGGDPAVRRRLLKTFADHPRRLLALGADSRLESRVAALVPSIVLLDVGASPDAGTFGTIAALSALAKIIVIADTAEDTVVLQALKAGASGVCPRSTPAPLMRKAIQLVEAGEIWIGRPLMVRLIEELASTRSATAAESVNVACLTERESAIATLIGRGAGNKDIAQALAISVKTVKTHLTNIFKKLGVSSRLQLALAMGPAAGSDRSRRDLRPIAAGSTTVRERQG
jgi:DNA-binding NarL/FixJ family response regulator